MGTATKPQKKISSKPAAKVPAKKRKLPVIGVAIVATALVIAAVILAAKSGYLSSPRSPEEIAASMLAALSESDEERFLKHVDVTSFAGFMDSTGLTRRDYAEANYSRRKELKAVHAELLAEDIFISANTSRKFQIIGQDVKETSAGIMIQPWIQFGSKLYKRLNFEKRGNRWKLTGLASPDA
jgi:hypothetical protein